MLPVRVCAHLSAGYGLPLPVTTGAITHAQSHHIPPHVKPASFGACVEMVRRWWNTIRGSVTRGVLPADQHNSSGSRYCNVLSHLFDDEAEKAKRTSLEESLIAMW